MENVRFRVLVADDDPRVTVVVRATLGSEETWELTQAVDGPAALDEVRASRPDLVLLDVMMPKLDGFAVCRAIKADPATATIKVVMLTALAEESDRRRAVEVGADDYLTKPFRPRELRAKVESLLSRP